jgi:hypothetical protein
MASRGQYLLRIAGRTKAKADVKLLDGLKADLLEIFKGPPAAGTGALSNAPGDGWPIGFVLKGYSVCQWKLSPLYKDKPYEPKHPDDKNKYPQWSDENTIDFMAEVHHTLDGPLYFNRHVMLDEVKWFYHHREYKWHIELVKRLEELNKKHAGALIERVWFRDWKWYCGNGGC